MAFSELQPSEEFVLIDFYAAWCEPCKWVEPILDNVIKNYSGKIKLQKIDIDERPEAAKEKHVLSVPTLVLLKNGTEVWRMRGFDTAPSLIRIFDSFLKKTNPS